MLDNAQWQDNIRNAASEVIANCDNGAEIVAFTLHKYGASSIEDLSPADYAMVFDELDYAANDN